MYLDVLLAPDSILCDTCMMSKFHRLPFQRSNSLASKSFELVHMDLWGPYKTPDISGAHSFLTVLDDHTRKSSRQTKPPAWLQDYVRSAVPSKFQYPILVPEDMSHLSDEYKTSLCNALVIHEPSCYEQA